MIDWTKEESYENLCGYCTGNPSGQSCNSSCFKDEYTPQAKNNRVKHVLNMLKIIPKQIEDLKKKEEAYRDSLSA